MRRQRCSTRSRPICSSRCSASISRRACSCARRYGRRAALGARARARRRRDGAAVRALDARGRRARVPGRARVAARRAAAARDDARARARRAASSSRARGTGTAPSTLRERDLRPPARRQAALRAAARELLLRPGAARPLHAAIPPALASNRAVPQTYADMWGDWYGVFAWSDADRSRPPPRRRAGCRRRTSLGLVPTAARAARLARPARALVAAAATRRGSLVALLPLAGIAGYLYFTVSYPTPDGDVLKPTYMLSTLGAWALCFGWARRSARQALRPRLVAAGARRARARRPALRRLQGRGRPRF